MLTGLRHLISKMTGPKVETDRSPGHAYSLARHQVLSYDKEIIAALAPFPESPPDAPAWGVVMEVGYPGFTCTLTAFSNGQTSLHSSDGMGVPYEGNNERIHQANAKLIAAANEAIPYLTPSASYPIPDPWQAHFYVRTDSGNLGPEGAEEDFRNAEHPLAALFAAGNEVLADLRLAAVAQTKDYLRMRIAELTDAIAQQPTPETYALRGEYYADLGEFDKARADFESLVSLMPVADAFLGRGCFFMKMGDLTSALADFNHAVGMEPTNAMAYSNRGAAYSKLEDMEQALANYDLAIQHEPNYATAYANRAFAYYKVGRYENGIADCNRALKLRPDLPATYSNRGLCRAALGDKEGARADFIHTLAFDPPPPRDVIEEALNGLYGLDHSGEPIPSWKSPSIWVPPS